MCPPSRRTSRSRRPIERTITVVDADRRPMQGAKVAAYGVGDPASARPEFRESLELRPDDGPLTAITGDGRTGDVLTASQDEGLVRRDEARIRGDLRLRRADRSIRLTPAANLSGKVTGPGGEPLAGVKVVLYTGFMWDFERTVTDAQGRYRFKDLRARGWDMSAWTPNKEADGTYKMWLDDDRVRHAHGKPDARAEYGLYPRHQGDEGGHHPREAGGGGHEQAGRRRQDLGLRQGDRQQLPVQRLHR